MAILGVGVALAIAAAGTQPAAIRPRAVAGRRLASAGEVPA